MQFVLKYNSIAQVGQFYEFVQVEEISTSISEPDGQDFVSKIQSLSLTRKIELSNRLMRIEIPQSGCNQIKSEKR